MTMLLANGHTLTLIHRPPTESDPEYWAVEERTADGECIGLAYGALRRWECVRWIERCVERGFGKY